MTPTSKINQMWNSLSSTCDLSLVHFHSSSLQIQCILDLVKIACNPRLWKLHRCRALYEVIFGTSLVHIQSLNHEISCAHSFSNIREHKTLWPWSLTPDLETLIRCRTLYAVSMVQVWSTSTQTVKRYHVHKLGRMLHVRTHGHGQNNNMTLCLPRA